MKHSSIVNLPIVLLSFGLMALTVKAQNLEPSAKLSETQLLSCERRLHDLGYWVDAVDGRLDDSTLAAIKAFRRFNGYKILGNPNVSDLLALENAKPLVLESNNGAHFEVDLKRQVIFFINDVGKVSLILPISTGSGKLFTEGGRTRKARTPRGRFTVYRKIYGWHKSPMGKMYYPSYIVGGVAIHGSMYVSDYPRTYGCITVPVFAAEKLSELMPIGTVVIIRS